MLHTLNSGTVAALVEVHLFSADLGITFGLETVRASNAKSRINSANSEFTQNVSSMDVHYINLTVSDEVVVKNDSQCNGNLHCGFRDVKILSTVDCDYAKV